MAERLGIFSWYGFVMPLKDRLRLIKKAGFDGITLWWEDEEGPNIIKKHDMPMMVRDEGLFLENIHVPFNNSDDLWSESKRIRESFITRHLRWLEDCAKHHIPMMVMHVTEGKNSVPSKYGLESFLDLVKAAKEFNVKISIENTRSAHLISFLLSEIKSPYLGFCFDSSHAGLRDHYHLLTEFKDRLFATHISDNDGKTDSHWLPENGVIDWEYFGRIFPKEYEGYFTLEICPTEEEAAQGVEKFLNKAYWKIKKVSQLCLKNTIKDF